MSASRHKAHRLLSGLARYLKALAKRLRKGPLSEDTAARVAVELDELLELRKQAAAAKSPDKGGGEKLEYNDDLILALGDGWGARRAKAPW